MKRKDFYLRGFGMRNKRFILLICMIVFLLAGLQGVFARGAKEEQKAEAEGTDALRAYEGTKITCLMESHSSTEALEAMREEFTDLTGIEVDFEVIAFRELTNKAALSLSQGDASYDVIFNMYDVLESYSENDYIYSLDEYIADDSLNMFLDMDDFIPGYLATGKGNDGKYYMLPVYGESTFMMYNEEVFQEYGLEVPKDLDALVETAKTIYQESDGEMYGITLRGAAGAMNIPFSTMLASCGGTWFDENGRCVIDSDESIRGVKYLVELMKYAPPGYSTYGWEENRLAFNQGKAAITIDATANGAYNEDPSESLIVDKVGYAQTPIQVDENELKVYPNSLTTHGLYINKFSENPEAAFLFITWATSSDVQNKSFRVSPNNGVTSMSVFESEAFKEKFGAFKDALVEAINRGDVNFNPSTTEASTVKAMMGQAVSQVFAGEKTAEQAMTDVAETINKDVLGLD